MDNRDPQNCWEYWNCQEGVRKKCSAYTTGSGRECWMMVGSDTSKDTRCPKLMHAYRHCWECPWFQKLNPDFDNTKIQSL